MKANFARPLGRVVTRHFAAVVRQKVGCFMSREPSEAGARCQPVIVELWLWFVVVVVVHVVCCAVFALEL